MSSSLLWIVLIIALALVFDFINGFHDSANAIATSVTTNALNPKLAILLAAILDFAGALTSTAVAKTIGKGIVDPGLITLQVVGATLLGAIFWNILTWWFGIPSSSSHALIGGLVGAVTAANGFMAIKLTGLIKVLSALLISPLLGITFGYCMMVLLLWVFRNKNPLQYNNYFRKAQIFSAALTAFSHGTNDAQKSMGIITMALVAGGFLSSFQVPLWVIIACATAISLGTYSGGWRIVRTVGSKITKIKPMNGFASDFSSSAVIFGATLLGVPVSTTHVVSSSIMGSGSTRRLTAVNWGIAKQIVTAWFVTIPVSAVVAILFYWAFWFIGQL